jgi:hypothetical protein
VAKCRKRKYLNMKLIMSTKKEARHEEYLPSPHGKKGSLSKSMGKNYCTHCNMSGHQMEKCWKLHPQLHLKWFKEVVKAPTKRQVATSVEVDDFAEKFEKEFSLMACLGSIVYEDIEAWFVDSGSSRHMTGMRSVFFIFSEIDSDCYVGCGTNTRHAVKGVGCVRFQLESGGSLEMEEMLFVPELKVNFLSVSSLEDEGYGVVFQHGQVLIYPERATQDTTIVHGVRYERLYRLLGKPVIGSSGFLDSESVSVSETDNCEASSSTVRRRIP